MLISCRRNVIKASTLSGKSPSLLSFFAYPQRLWISLWKRG